jgi:sulfite reductase (NADPH) hemoprotein beta-component
MKALTANRLDDGEVVFWKQGRWVPSFGDAELFDEDRTEAAIAAEAHAKTEVTVVVEPYLIDLTPSEGRWAPLSYRERIRALGPTNKPDHGKQAEGGSIVEALQHASGAARSTGRVNLIKRK